MDRAAKGVRVAGALLLFLNLAAFFLPLSRIDYGNYGQENISSFQYLQKILIPDASNPTDYGLSVILVVLLLMLLPAVLSLTAGIIGLVGSPKQIVSGILAILVAGMYAALYLLINRMAPVWSLKEGQTAYWGYAYFISLGVSGSSAILGIISFIVRPRIRKTESSAIPQLNEIRQEQENARYNIVQPMTGSGDRKMNMNAGEKKVPLTPEIKPDIQPNDILLTGVFPRGVLVGLTGIYAGAEISFKDGESIRLGRMTDNDLVFDNQPRVSRNHCVLTWRKESNNFEIIDYSSNGSYINEQEDCLPQNMKIILAPGTILDIGSEENRFRLEYRER